MLYQELCPSYHRIIRVINGSPADTWIFNRVTPVEDKDKSGKIKNLKSYKLNKKKHRLRCPNKDL